MFRTVSLSIIRSLALYVHTAMGVCHAGYADCLLADSQQTCMTYTYCCVYSARLLMMASKSVRNM